MEEESIIGTVRRLIFRNAVNGYAVALLELDDNQKELVAAGIMHDIDVGHHLQLWGKYVEHPKYGQQFKTSGSMPVQPSTKDGLVSYLASGIISGIGLKTAERIVDRFGDDTFEIIDNNPERLLELPRFPRKALDSIKEHWAGQRAVRDIMLVLLESGLSPNLSRRIYDTYSFAAVDILKSNPYKLIKDIKSIGFKSADSIAAKVGIALTARNRLKSGVVYVLEETTKRGHTAYPLANLIDYSSKLLKVDPELVEETVSGMLENNDLILLDGNTNTATVALKWLYLSEKAIAQDLQRLVNGPRSISTESADAALKELQVQTNLSLNVQQRQAIHTATSSKVCVITGGPGTGKTTIVRFITKALGNARLMMCAPTGRAARRLADTSGHPAFTIHRMLGITPEGSRFHEENRLEVDLVVVDEFSMVDTILMYRLLKALPDNCHLLLVGDAEQLPSVGAGALLTDLTQSKTVPVVVLKTIYRQSKRSTIVSLAHSILEKPGSTSMAEFNSGQSQDFLFLPQRQPVEISQAICSTINNMNMLTGGQHYDPLREIQVITPMHRGEVGTENLNHQLRQALNHKGSPIPIVKDWRIGDKVMQIKNDYEKNIFNGELGIIQGYDEDQRNIMVRFENREHPIAYDINDAENIIPAYAISVHKSQGCEFPCVILPLSVQHYVMLQRNLIYTAITRARKMLIIIGEERAFTIAAKNIHVNNRHTRLAKLLQQYLPQHLAQSPHSHAHSQPRR